ncbi:hypothetical protein HMPREF1981_01187 [Bacteroides pyogenes F0041]|uniref:Uncharacterized protein n=1 Tax=Bacteroides pyogenes F0041 TaxID=1321819 RepID=U2C669_9BACE|nr:hypothetical protein HMPREF1981_01187 [Bacteroides pyogenes F0041]
MVGNLLLFKQKSATGDAMFQRNGGHGKRTVFINHLRAFRIKLVEKHFVRQCFMEKLHPRRKQLFQTVGRMDMQIGGTPQQAERRNQSRQAETVVAMQMGDKHPVQPRKLQPRTAQLQLRSFSAVDHKEFVAQVDDLGGREVTGGGQGRTAPQYM